MSAIGVVRSIPASKQWHIPNVLSVSSLSPMPILATAIEIALGVLWVLALVAAVGLWFWQRRKFQSRLDSLRADFQQQLDTRAAALTKATEQLRRQTAAREKTEQALRESKALYQSLLEGLPLNLFRKDLEGHVVMANRRYCETLEQPLDELLGKTDHDLFPDELADKYRRDDLTVMETGSVFEDVERHRRPNGEWLYVQVFKSPARDAQGKIIGVQVMFWDVTARRRAEESLLQERFLLRSLLDNVPAYIYFKDTKGRFIRINRCWPKNSGWLSRRMPRGNRTSISSPKSTPCPPTATSSGSSARAKAWSTRRRRRRTSTAACGGP